MRSGNLSNATTGEQSRPPLPVFTYAILPHLLLSLFLAIHPRPRLSFRIATWFCLTAVLLRATKFRVGGNFDNWGWGVLLGSLSFTSFVLLFLWDPAADCRHESWSKDESMTQMPYWKRAYMMLCVILSVRGIGWNYEASSARVTLRCGTNL